MSNARVGSAAAGIRHTVTRLRSPLDLDLDNLLSYDFDQSKLLFRIEESRR